MRIERLTQAITKQIRICQDLDTADYPARVKYGGFNDYRGGGRFSGRVTVALIMAGAIAKKLLSRFDVDVLAYTTAVGKVKTDKKISAEEISQKQIQSADAVPRLSMRRKNGAGNR